jgi:hypothetical protein
VVYFCDLYGVDLSGYFATAGISVATVVATTATANGGHETSSVSNATPVAAGGSQNQGGGNGSGGGNSNIGAIVGGAVGGFVVLCILIGAMFYIWRTSPTKRKQRQRTSEMEEDVPVTKPFFPDDQSLARKKELEKRGGIEPQDVEPEGRRAGNLGLVVPEERNVNESDDVAPSGRLRYPDHAVENGLHY